MKVKFSTLILLAAAVAVSCSKQDANAPRKDSFEVYATSDCSGEPLEAFCVDVRENTSELFLKTNVSDFEVFWQDALLEPWAKVVSCENVSSGIYKVTLSYDALSDAVTYTRRSGTLAFSKPAINYGLFFPVHQGAVERTFSDFSDIKYGSWLPTDAEGETEYGGWSSVLKDKGYVTEKVNNADTSALYGKFGMVKLGDAEGRKGALITPVNANHRYDSLLMVTFKAAAYKGDLKKFCVEVIGGGVFKDELASSGKKMVLEAPYINEDAVTQEELWPAEGHFVLFINSTQTSPLGVNTQFRFTSGAEGQGNARLFIDDFRVYKLVDGIDLDYYTLNQGSGTDKILVKQ